MGNDYVGAVCFSFKRRATIKLNFYAILHITLNSKILSFPNTKYSNKYKKRWTKIKAWFYCIFKSTHLLRVLRVKCSGFVFCATVSVRLGAGVDKISLVYLRNICSFVMRSFSERNFAAFPAEFRQDFLFIGKKSHSLLN